MEYMLLIYSDPSGFDRLGESQVKEALAAYGAYHEALVKAGVFRGTHRLRDALRHLVSWSRKNERAFEIEELPSIFEEATGVDTREIFDRWLKPLEVRP